MFLELLEELGVPIDPEVRERFSGRPEEGDVSTHQHAQRFGPLDALHGVGGHEDDPAGPRDLGQECHRTRLETGVETRSRLVEQEVLRAARDVLPRENPSCEALAAYHLSWRTQMLFRDVLDLADSRTTVAMSFLTRAMSEIVLHAGLIGGPLRPSDAAKSSPFSELQSEMAPQHVRDRLRGYLAWVTRNEIAALERLRRPEALRLIFEPETAREHSRWVNDRLADCPDLASLFRDPETFTDAEAEKEREEFDARAKAQLRRTRKLYRHLGLASWRAVIKGTPLALALGDLLDETPDRGSSLASSWSKASLDIGRLFYDEASAMLHGSSLSPAATVMEGRVIAPSFGSIAEPEVVANRMASTTQLAAVQVWQLARIAVDGERDR